VSRSRFVLTVLLALAIAATAAGQTGTVPLSSLSIRTIQPTLTQTLGDGGTLSFAADGIGLTSDATVTVTYKPALPTLAATLTAVDLTGSTDFSVTGLVDINTVTVVLTQNAPSISIGVRYRPSTSKAAVGKVSFSFLEADTAVALAFRGNRAMTIGLNLAGASPELVPSYAVLPNGPSTQLNQGDVIQLPATNLTTDTASVVITVTNRGTAPGVINGVTLKGDTGFALAGVPFPPISVDGGKALSFSVRYTPAQIEPLSAAVRIDFATGKSVSFNVVGSGLGPVYLYEVLTSRGAAPIDPNSTVTLPDAVIGGDKTTTTIRVTNTGNADGRLTAISAAGTGFALAESPFVPFTFVAGTSFTVVVSFTPTQPGKSTGRLRIGDDNFNLESNALGSNLTFAYAAGGGATIVSSAGTVVFTPVAVGGTTSLQFTARNEGTAPTQINSISVTGTGTTFATDNLPALPARLGPGASVTFSLVFTPVTTGANTGTLRVDTNVFALSGSASAPAALPDYSFQGASGAVDAQQQPAVGLSLNAAYPLALNGTLNLAFTSDVFASDPAVQFASGGRSVPFTIAANSRQAVFPNGATQMRIQTGTVAGTISLTPTFATQSGAIDLTPTTPPAVTLTIPPTAPRLLAVSVSSKTVNSFTLLVTGYATNRSITQMDIQFTPLAGETVSTAKLSLGVKASFDAWYQSTASAPYGGLFTASVPFTLQGDVKNVTNVVDTVQSVSVTLTNQLGVSTAGSVNLR
jgi:hypothetical protein